MSKGSAKLAAVLQKRMKSVSNYGSNVNAELATISSGLGLKLDSLPGVTISSGEYFVCQSFKNVTSYLKSNVAGAENIDTNILKPGDRVLVIWTFDGEIVVVDKILKASSL